MPRPFLGLVAEDEADRLRKEEYDAAVERAGKVFNILKSMSLNPPVLRASMFGERSCRAPDGVGIEAEPEWSSR